MTFKQYKRAMLVSSAQVTAGPPPAALGFLAGVCETLSVDYDVIDINVEIAKRFGSETWSQMYNNTEIDWAQWPQDLQAKSHELLQELCTRIQQFDPDLVAVTVLSFFQHTWTTEFLKILKQCLPAVTTIAGGPGMSPVKHNAQVTYGKWLVEHDLLDYYALGEGDTVFPNFLKGNTDVLGLNSKHTLESWQPQLDNLNASVFPTYKKFKKSDYTFKENFYVSITGSRGCVKSCSFCDVQYYWKKYRFKDALYIASEIHKHYREIGVTNFSFNDSLINGSLKNFNNLLDRLLDYKKKHNLRDLQITGQFIIRPKNSHPEIMYQKMAAAGVNKLSTGIESGSYDVRVHMRKNFTDEDMDWHFAMCEKYKIENSMLMLVGYPTETLQDFGLSLALLKKYRKYVINKTINSINVVHPMVLLPNTPLTEQANELMLEYDNNDIYQWISKRNPDLDLNERIRRVVEFATQAINYGYRIPDRIKYFFESAKQQQHFKISNEIY